MTQFPSELVEIDPASGTVANTAKLDTGAAGVAVGGGAVWVANTLKHTVLRIDPRTMRVTKTITIGAKPTGITFGNGAVWVSAA